MKRHLKPTYQHFLVAPQWLRDAIGSVKYVKFLGVSHVRNLWISLVIEDRHYYLKCNTRLTPETEVTLVLQPTAAFVPNICAEGGGGSGNDEGPRVPMICEMF